MSDTTEIAQLLLGPDDDRKPTRRLNYRGRVNRPNPAVPMGPNYSDELLYPVTYSYDPKTKMSQVGLSYIVPNWDKIFGEAPHE
jgi:hypothetical protein